MQIRIRRPDHRRERRAGRRVAGDGPRAGRGRDIDGEHAEERAVGVKDLNPPVRSIADVDLVPAVDGDRMGKAELSRPSSALTPRLHPVPVLVVFCDPRIDVPVADVGVAVRVPRDVRGLAEQTVDRGERRIRVSPRLSIVGRLLPAAEDHHDAAGLIELDHHVRTLVDRPDVVRPVDADGVSERPAVEALADLAPELALRTEFEQLRRGRGIGRPVRAVRAGEHVDVPPGVHGDARDFAEVHPFGELEEVSHRVERDRRHCLLSERGAGAKHCQKRDHNDRHRLSPSWSSSSSSAARLWLRPVRVNRTPPWLAGNAATTDSPSLREAFHRKSTSATVRAPSGALQMAGVWADAPAPDDGRAENAVWRRGG